MANRKCTLKTCRSELPSKALSDVWQAKGFCSCDHMVEHGLIKGREQIERKRKADELGIKKRNTAFKKKVQLSDVKTRKAAAKKACHEYIRERDKNKPCICCGKPLGDEYHAGHWLESGNNPAIRYNEDNIHGQRVDCNYFKGGDSGDYKENLIERIGSQKVEKLLEMKKDSVKRTAQDYLEIESYFKSKLKQLSVINQE